MAFLTTSMARPRKSVLLMAGERKGEWSEDSRLSTRLEEEKKSD
jgi:hypothetical protein